MKPSNLCEQFAEKLPQFRAGALAQELAKSLEAHKESCPDCALLLKKDEALDGLFALPSEIPAEHQSAIADHIESLSESDRTPIPWLWVGVLSALVLFTVIASWRPTKASPKQTRKTWRQEKGLSKEDMPKEGYRDTRG